MTDDRHGIVHVIGPEQGITLPGITLVCGDSHTSTHGALGCVAFGLGSTDVKHVLVTQTIWQRRPKMMRISITGRLGFGVSGKDLILAVIREISAAGGTGHAIEYAGAAIDALPMEGRMTVCNMTIEAGARSGIIAPDEHTIAYCAGRPYAPKGMALTDVTVDTVFIGACTNSRIEDMRAAAQVAKGRRARVRTLVVPGSGLVKKQAEAEGLDASSPTPAWSGANRGARCASR